jgi:hypothetical protein
MKSLDVTVKLLDIVLNNDPEDITEPVIAKLLSINKLLLSISKLLDTIEPVIIILSDNPLPNLIFVFLTSKSSPPANIISPINK